MRKLSIIIPCYNEKRTIREIVGRVSGVFVFGWDKEIIIVDDGSTDGTRDILKELSEVKVILHEKNSGKGSAVKTGISHAKGDFVLIQDADLEYAPEEIPALLSLVKHENDIVYGSRNLIQQHRRRLMIAPRLGVWFISKLINALYGARLTDAWTCYKLFPARAAEHFSAGGFDSELLFTTRVLREGYIIKEAPISHSPRDKQSGKKIRYRDGFISIWLIIKDWFMGLKITKSDKSFLLFLFSLAVLVASSVYFLNPHIDPNSDSPSYIESMKVLNESRTEVASEADYLAEQSCSGACAKIVRQGNGGGRNETSFTPNRIITTFGGLEVVVIISKLFGSYESAWLFMNIIFYFVAGILFYKIVKILFRSDITAFICGIFLSSSYAMVSFGLNYYMDMGGWFFYIASIYFLLYYIQSKENKYIILAAVAVGIGGLFKEYAFLGSIPIGVFLLYEYWPHLGAYFKKILIPAIIVIIPSAILHLAVYYLYGYTYFDWLNFNQGYYVYSSRIIEYIKTFGSLLNILGIISLVGIYYFIKKNPPPLVSLGVPPFSKGDRVYIISLILSVLPIFFWPAITQRIVFITVPVLVILAGFVIKKHEKHWQFFIPVVIIYILLSFNMNWFLNVIDLPI